MTRMLPLSIGIAFLGCAALAAERKVDMKNLPAAVQKTVQEQAKGAEIKGITRETVKGVIQYEIETLVNGKHRDFNVDSKGALLVVEEETSIESIPDGAKTAILTKVGTGALGRVEIVTKGLDTFYEVGYTTQSGKKIEAMVRADGILIKDE
jgi:hypothetical protein